MKLFQLRKLQTNYRFFLIISLLNDNITGVIMVKIIYIEHDGTEHPVDVDVGTSIMEGAVSNSIPGIDADCGGGCACATCMVFIDDEWKDKMSSMSDEEESMLDFHEYKEDSSRLGCQIPITEEFDGLKVKMPPSQH